jgi:hypothetical protein
LFSIPTKLKRTRPAPLVEDIDGRDEVLGEDERVVARDEGAEWTDPLVPMEIEGVVAESTARRVLVNPRVLEHRRAGFLLKAMRLLEDEGSKRAALPPLTALEDNEVWSNPRLRALAVICGLNPPQGSRRKPLLRLLGSFLDGRVGPDLDGAHVEPDLDGAQLQGATPPCCALCPACRTSARSSPT